VIAGLVSDLWSKHWAFHSLRQGGHRTLIPKVLELHTTLNPGALFGIGAGHTEVFLVASVLALGLVVWMFAQCPPRRWLTHVALGAILAGALGNMYDRAFVDLVVYGQATVDGTVVRHYVPSQSPDGKWILLHEYPPDPGQRPHRLPITEKERLGRPVGYVRDFIKIPTKPPQWSWIPARIRGRELWPWVFNVADMLLVGGVAILAVRMIKDRKAARPGGRPALDSAAQQP